MKKLLPLLFWLICCEQAGAAYRYSYIPKSVSPTIYNFLYSKREKCSVGEKKEYPKQIGVCATCPEGTVYLIDETLNKPACFKCPAGTLSVKRNGYPMCLGTYPVVNGKAVKPNGGTPSGEEMERIALQLSADYKISLSSPSNETEKTFKHKEKLVNVCPSMYPNDEAAQKQIDICRRLVSQNDFLCPYVEKNADGKWICRACPKNAPYKNKQGGCFNCPYGEEMVSSDDGEPVCASEVPPEKKQDAVRTKRLKKKKSVAR